MFSNKKIVSSPKNKAEYELNSSDYQYLNKKLTPLFKSRDRITLKSIAKSIVTTTKIKQLDQ